MSTDIPPHILAKRGKWWKNAWQAQRDRVKWPSWQSNGRLAQLVAHPLDVREVTSSSLVSSTMRTWTKSSGSLLFLRFPPLLCLKSSQIQKQWKSSNHAKVMVHSKMVTFSAFLASKSYPKTVLQVFCLYRGSYGLLFKFCRTSIWLPNNFDLTFYSSERACM